MTDRQPYELEEITENIPWLRLVLLAIILWGIAYWLT
jgi:hypothetical protein